MTATDIPYDGDGSTMIGRLSLPEGEGTRPAILIAHEGNGLDDYQKSRPERFAELMTALKAVAEAVGRTL